MKKLFVLLAMTGMSAFTLAADEPQGWTYYAADDAENPFLGEGIGCLSNETWMLCANIRSAASNTLIVSPRNDHENAFLNGVSNAETLDLRGTITSPDGATTYTAVPNAALRDVKAAIAALGKVSAPPGKLSMGDKVAELEKAGT